MLHHGFSLSWMSGAGSGPLGRGAVRGCVAYFEVHRAHVPPFQLTGERHPCCGPPVKGRYFVPSTTSPFSGFVSPGFLGWSGISFHVVVFFWWVCRGNGVCVGTGSFPGIRLCQPPYIPGLAGPLGIPSTLCQVLVGLVPRMLCVSRRRSLVHAGVPAHALFSLSCASRLVPVTNDTTEGARLARHLSALGCCRVNPRFPLRL